MNEPRLQGRVAIVTGAGAGLKPGDGIGDAIALLFARHGGRVAVLDIDEERATATAAEIEREGGEALIVVADVTHRNDCQRAVEETRRRFGTVNVLVNNVGIAGSANVADVDEEEWDRVMAVNAKSALLMCQAAMSILREGGGSIVNVASTAALLPNGLCAYGASKAAMLTLTREIAVSYGRDGVRANAICPGNVYSAMVAGMDEQTREIRRKSSPLGVEGNAWDVAWTALFLASDESRFVNGVTIPVDGGVILVEPRRAQWLLEN